MERVFFQNKNCSVARTMDVVGDWWSVLIVLEAFHGTRRFDDFQKNLEISKGILSKRLKSLQEHDVLVKKPAIDGSRRTEYRLTEKGKTLQPVLIAFQQWGDRWLSTSGAPMILYNSETGEELAPLEIRDVGGNIVQRRNVQIKPGPGADEITQKRFKAAEG